MKIYRAHILLPLLLAILFLSGCYTRGVLVIPAETHSHSTTVVTRHVPPPHAPAHGHRHRHHDHELRFDSGFGAYLVINVPGLYFYNDHYMRFHNNGWQITNRLNGKWRAARQNDVPRKLKNRHAKKHRTENRKEHRNEHRKEDRREQRRDQHEAPKHGHRRHHHNHELRFDAGIGAYTIRKQPGIYFLNNRYLRHHRGAWQTTKKLNGRWRAAKDKEIPRKLKKAKQTKKEKRNKKSERRHKEKWQ